MQLNWDDLKVVLAIGRARSLTRAALLLGIDQSTAGRRLAAAEAALGRVLFVRSKTGLHPTDCGDEAIARAVEIESRALALADSLAGGSDGPAGPVRLVGPAWVVKRLVERALPALLRRHPRLRLDTIGAPQPVGQDGHQAGLGLWFDALARDNEFAIKLGDVPFALYAPADAAMPLDWVTLSEADGAPPPGAASLLLLAKASRAAAVPPDATSPADTAPPCGRLRMTATDPDTVAAAIAAGLGRGLLPTCIGDGDRRLARHGGSEPRALYLHLHPDTLQTARLQVVIDAVRGTFADVFVQPPAAGQPPAAAPASTDTTLSC